MLATARLQRTWSTASGRGFLLLGISMFAFGLALAAQENTVTNYFEDVLGFEGPQFGYITAIREIPGFLLIFLTALFYRMALQRLTALALVVLAVGYVCFGFSNSFWTVAPWVILTSMGYHTVLQTRYALGMSSNEARSGAVLGKINAIDNAGAVVAMALVLVTFHFGWLSFRPLFVIAGLLALVAAAAIYFFPTMHDGVQQTQTPQRAPIVFRRPYRFYYYLCLLDGGRQQIFFSFGLWVLVHVYGLSVPQVSAVLLAVRGLGAVSSPWIGRMVDRHGERAMLTVVNAGYLVALSGYALVHNIYVACLCYLIYSLIFPLSTIGSATYLRKVAVSEEIAPSLAMGVTLQHAAAIVVPVTTGIILNYVGYQIPFLIACGFACFTFFVTQRLDPLTQKSPARIAQDREREQSVEDRDQGTADSREWAGDRSGVEPLVTEQLEVVQRD